MNIFVSSDNISCVKIINNLIIKKIKYQSFYNNKKIYHETKIYFKNHKHSYYISSIPSGYGVGDKINITYFKYKHCNKRYLKSIRYNLTNDIYHFPSQKMIDR